MEAEVLLKWYMVGAFVCTVYFGFISGKYRLPLNSTTLFYIIMWPTTLVFYIVALLGMAGTEGYTDDESKNNKSDNS